MDPEGTKYRIPDDWEGREAAQAYPYIGQDNSVLNTGCTTRAWEVIPILYHPYSHDNKSRVRKHLSGMTQLLVACSRVALVPDWSSLSVIR